MSRAVVVAVLGLVVTLNAINRPVYKIVLTQKGYAQFLQYDVVTPPLREFTFCTWIRVYDLDHDQSIFTYVANGNNRIIRMWLDSGGRHMKVSINGKATSSVRVEVVKDVWRHVCLSYQSDYGAWALYIDSRLIACESVKRLTGFVLAGGGSVIIGYGNAYTGTSNGFEGEIFGANMLLSSTIERNYTMKLDPLYKQKRFPKNKLKSDSRNNNYVVLSDLQNDEIQNSYETSQGILTKKLANFKPHGFVEHSIGLDDGTTKTNQNNNKNASSKEFLDITISDFMATNQDKIDFWNTPKITFSDMYKSQVTRDFGAELSKSGTKIIHTVSEYETPPPPTNAFIFDNTFDLEPPAPSKSIYNLSKSTSNLDKDNKQLELSDVETPPPVDKNTKVYGQWTSSKYAGTVLNYLKNINFKNRENIIKRTPHTIPLHKLSDSHPYPSDFKLNIVRPPSQFKRRNVVEKRYDVIRRDSQINLQILEDDLRNHIAKMHAETQPKNVEITNRGAAPKLRDHRFIRHINDEKSVQDPRCDLQEYQPKQFVLNEERKKNHRYFADPASLIKTRPTVQPVLKSLEYLMQDSFDFDNQASTNPDDSKETIDKAFEQRNKWHNAKSYSNDYTPRKLSIDDEIEDEKKLYPSVRLKYKNNQSIRKYVANEDDPTIKNARKLASQVSLQSFAPKDTVSILKYNNGYLTTQNDNRKNRGQAKRNMEHSNFEKHVKIGNALNERDLIGVNEEQNKKSFVGGDENIPDINKYRSKLDKESEHGPPSLGNRMCRSVELYDKALYVQKDESIDMTPILSPVKDKNIAIEFIIQNYKKCSLTDSSFQKNAMLLVDWSKTPVRLFGGAFPRTTTDLCGFF